MSDGEPMTPVSGTIVNCEDMIPVLKNSVVPLGLSEFFVFTRR
jgi:hypothetical protein